MKKKPDYHIINYMEELVSATLKGIISKMSKKEQPDNRMEADIKALALNRLWPMYTTTERGKKFVQKDIVTDKIDGDVKRELQAAMQLVCSHPRK